MGSMPRPSEGRVRAALGWPRVACATGLWALTACSPAQTSAPPSVPVASDPPPPVYVATFRLEDAGEDAEGTPRTRVLFVMHSATEPSVTEELGSEAGGCVERPADERTLMRVSCWWGPSESHWAARRTPSGVALLRAEGPRESLPPVGEGLAWEVRVTLPLLSRAQVTRLSD